MRWGDVYVDDVEGKVIDGGSDCEVLGDGVLGEEVIGR